MCPEALESPSDSFVSLGVTSAQALMIGALLSRKLELHISAKDVIDAGSIDRLVLHAKYICSSGDS
ncbi:acyl carrier protein [Actinomyces lilanjuaniae]|uniref:Acyl carrier protein n=1 Tax=Actinomyces lilanjuaniae TaxID=2321394 RepID=A0ABN5PQ53_9ACTO|nr:acyl carrier protein [Actinomyces lilanjuaniae]